MWRGGSLGISTGVPCLVFRFGGGGYCLVCWLLLPGLHSTFRGGSCVAGLFRETGGRAWATTPTQTGSFARCCPPPLNLHTYISLDYGEIKPSCYSPNFTEQTAHCDHKPRAARVYVGVCASVSPLPNGARLPAGLDAHGKFSLCVIISGPGVLLCGGLGGVQVSRSYRAGLPSALRGVCVVS